MSENRPIPQPNVDHEKRMQDHRQVEAVLAASSPARTVEDDSV